MTTPTAPRLDGLLLAVILGIDAGTISLTDPALVRPDIRLALDEWGNGSRPHTGDFLRAVLSNDLLGAVGRADSYHLLTLPAAVMYVANYLPEECWGSRALVDAWAAKHTERLRAEREQREQAGAT